MTAIFTIFLMRLTAAGVIAAITDALLPDDKSADGASDSARKVIRLALTAAVIAIPWN